MRLQHKMMIALDNMRNRKGAVVLVILMTCFLLLLITILCSFYYQKNYYQITLEETLPYDTERVGFVCDIEGDIYEKVKQMEGIQATGSWEMNARNSETIEFLQEKQKGHKIFKDWLGLETIDATTDTFHMYRWNLVEGDKPEAYKEQMGENVHLVYLGNAYAGTVDIGAVYTEPISENVTYTYIIAGVLEKNSKINTPEMYNIDNADINGAYNLDYEVVLLNDDSVYWPYYYVIEEGADMDKITEQIFALYSDAVEHVQAGTIASVLHKLQYNNKTVNTCLMQLMVAMGLTIFVLIVTGQVVHIMTNAKEYGIWYANGATTGELLQALLWENMMKFLVACLIAMPIGYAFTTRFLTTVGFSQMIFRNIFLERIVPILLGVSVVLTLCVSVIPMVFFAKKKPVQMVRGN